MAQLVDLPSAIADAVADFNIYGVADKCYSFKWKQAI